MDKHYCKAARDCGCTIWDHGKVRSICAEMHCLDYALLEPMTNADRIRATSNEELAAFIESQRVCQICHRRMNNCFPADVSHWLRQPVEEVDPG